MDRHMTSVIEGRRMTNKSLADQLQINDREIAYRKFLLDLTEEDVECLRGCYDHVARSVDDLVERFYDGQLKIPEISLLIGDAETLQRLRISVRRYILELFEGYYDSEYVNKRLRIGKVHERIGVSPKLYVSAITKLEKVILSILDRDPAMAGDPTTAERRRTALRKLMMFDVQLVFDTYISSLVAEVESARGQLEDYAASLEAIIEKRTRQLKELSTRDPLTGLLNQRGFREHLRREISVAERSREPVALAYLDLNGFKALNDSLGHQAGDQALNRVGQLLSASVREVDIPCRYGGDEFCVIMPRTDGHEVRIICERIVESFEQADDLHLFFSMGVGVAYPGSAETWKAWSAGPIS
jgi:diguanylate cyclase (GGDEF)-like protein